MEDQQTTQSQETRRLPLWKDLLDRMIEAGFEENKTWPLDFFVEGLGKPANSVGLAMGIHHIRTALRRMGWVLTSRGQNGTQFFLMPRKRNADEMMRLQSAAISALREGVVLGTCTPLEVLTAEERRRHESVLEKLAVRSALMDRSLRTLGK